MRTIVHLDADCFFAAVEQASDSKLRGKPVAVGGEKRGIIASASYEARQFGVFTPMPTARARKLCPKLIVLPGDFERYEQFSNWMFGYCYDFTPDVEQTSIDEGYFDLTANKKKSAREIALTIRKAIGQKLKIMVSEGIGSNKLVSAIASKLTKPAAFNEIPYGHEIPFLHPLPTQWLPGIGPKTSSRLQAAGLALIQHVAATPLEMLELVLGSQAREIRRFAHGIDDRPIVPARVPQKTFSHQETFVRDVTDEDYAEATLRRMADTLCATLRAEHRSARTLTVRVRYNDMAEDQSSVSLSEPTDLETDIYGRLRPLLRTAWKRRVSLRLVSLKLSQIYDHQFSGELPLTTTPSPTASSTPNSSTITQREIRTRLALAIDSLRNEQGHHSILRGHDLILRDSPRDLLTTTTPPLPENKTIYTLRSNSQKTNPPGSHISPQSPPRTRINSSGFKRISTSKPLPTSYVPLRVHSHFSFLDSTLSPKTIIDLAQQYHLSAIALTDIGNLHGASDFAQAAAQATPEIKPIFGVEFTFENTPLLLYAESLDGYHHLNQIISRHALRPPTSPAESSVVARQRRPIHLDTIQGHTVGLIAIGHTPKLADLFPGAYYQRVTSSHPSPLAVSAAPHFGTHSPYNSHPKSHHPQVACPPIHYPTPKHRLQFDIIQSIRTLTLLRETHPEKRLDGHFHFRSPITMTLACQQHPDWLLHTFEIAERCNFKFPFGKPQFPHFHPPDGSTPHHFLETLVLNGLHQRYRHRSHMFTAQVREELDIIAAVGYESYFLVVWDLLQTCRQRGIEWITRGSAADSLVCYCLGISDVCPIRFDLYFKRFLNQDRMALNKLPDIDVDFPHDRKDDVVQLLFEKYGPQHCAVVGGFSTFQARSAFAEVAKVLGVAEREVRKFTEHFPWGFGGGWVPDQPAPKGGSELIELLRANPETRSLPLDEEPYKTAIETAAFLDGVPRYPKMHPCGVVLSRQTIPELTPVFVSHKGLPTSHYDMDAVELIGLVKMDILAQGGLAVIRDAIHSLAQRGISIHLTALEPWNDPAVWDMISQGHARAVHHIESPAMVSLCRMTHVQEIDGLIAIVSVIRPGAANESKKLSFTRRYQGLEPITYPHPSLELCLRSTFGLVVYEEHILQICESFAGLPPGRADVLRRALVKQKHSVVREIAVEFSACARQRGHDEHKITEVWKLVTGFSGYAFNKAHSTAYGVEAYQAAWLKCYYPAEFMAGVLTHGKGFYHPIVYVLECHRLHIPLLPPCINEPGPQFIPIHTPTHISPHNNPNHPPSTTPTTTTSIRVPVTRVKGLSQNTIQTILNARSIKPFSSIDDFFHRVGPSSEEFESMVRVGAFDKFGESRTRLFWKVQHLIRTYGQTQQSGQGWLIPPPSLEQLPAIPLNEPTHLERLTDETNLLGFAVSGHPLELFPDIAWDTYCPVNRLNQFIGQIVVTCGLVVEQRTHHQITGEPMKFLSLADHTGIVETELFAQTYKSYALATIRYPVLEIEASVEPYENQRGFSLRILRAGKPRTIPK